MISTIEVQSQVEELVIPDVKMSDWIESQPLSRFTSHTVRRKEKMCGLGMVADFLGAEWSKLEGIDHDDKLVPDFIPTYAVADFIADQGIDTGLDTNIFDTLYDLEGPQAAKNYVVRTLRERGL